LTSKLTKALLIGIGLVAATLALLVLTFILTRPDEPVDASTTVGFAERTYVDTNRNRTLVAHVWYPTQSAIAPELLASNALFYGYAARPNAQLPRTKLPLVLVSHGSGGNNTNQGWLAVELAASGILVIAPNHPGSTSQDSAPSTNIQAWNRPQDISFLLDTLLNDPELSRLIDETRIAIIGHSLGGYTALAVGGASLSKTAFIDYCDSLPKNPDCVFYKSGGVDLRTIDSDKFEQSHKDNRVKAVVALDPAYGRAFTEDSLSTLPPTLLISPKVKSNTIDDLQIDYLREQISKHSHVEVRNIVQDGANHFSYLRKCKPFAGLILGIVETGAQVLCGSETGTTRDDIHEITRNEVVSFLKHQHLINP